MLRQSRVTTAVAVLATFTAACSSERATAPKNNLQACGASAMVVGSFDPLGLDASPVIADPGPSIARTTSMASVSIAPLSGTVVSFPGPSAQLSDTNARYLVVPQYAVQGSKPDSTAFMLTVGTGAAAVQAPFSLAASRTTSQSSFDLRLRATEARLPAGTRLSGPQGGLRAAATVSAPDTVRSFYVLGDINGNCFVQTKARLRYSGARVYVYEDTGVQPGDTLTTSQYASFGKLFDDVLYPIDTNAFGSPSDIDRNGHIIVLLSQHINALTTKTQCQTSGYIAGYFFGYDLTSGTGSNRGEIFYAISADSAGKFSCAHSKATLLRGTPPTFIHEFQHMISYNQHVLLRGGSEEVTWLNEGMSHIAEELGSKYYEAKYPAPTGRTSPSQLFPDSSQGFIVPDFNNAYNYLASSTKHSVTTFTSTGTLEERGGAWLFLRWLADQKGGDGIFKQLEQTTRTGVDNVANVAGEPFQALFGAFGIATYADSIDGIPRSAIPTRYRFTSRDTHLVYGRVCNSIPIGQSACPQPIVPVSMSCAGSSTRKMVQGTSAYYLVGGTTGCSNTQLNLTDPSGIALPSSLNPQLAIFRLP